MLVTHSAVKDPHKNTDNHKVHVHWNVLCSTVGQLSQRLDRWLDAGLSMYSVLCKITLFEVTRRGRGG